jgi:hypothetical protein
MLARLEPNEMVRRFEMNLDASNFGGDIQRKIINT